MGDVKKAKEVEHIYDLMTLEETGNEELLWCGTTYK